MPEELKGTIFKKWSDRTMGRSNFEGLHFKDDHFWTDGHIDIICWNPWQTTSINIKADNQEIKKYSKRGKNHDKINFSVNGDKNVDVNGYIRRIPAIPILGAAEAEIHVFLNYDNEKMMGTEGYVREFDISSSDTIEMIYLKGNHYLRKCTIAATILEGTAARIKYSLIQNGQPVKLKDGKEEYEIRQDLAPIMQENITGTGPIILNGWIKNMVPGKPCKVRIELLGYFVLGE